jgi:hypothetical protein
MGLIKTHAFCYQGKGLEDLEGGAWTAGIVIAQGVHSPAQVPCGSLLVRPY